MDHCDALQVTVGAPLKYNTPSTYYEQTRRRCNLHNADDLKTLLTLVMQALLDLIGQQHLQTASTRAVLPG